MPSRGVDICRPFDVVAEQVLALGGAWFEDTGRRVGLPATASGGRRPLLVRVGWPSLEPRMLRLPIEWEVPGDDAAAWTLRGELQVRPVSDAETRIGLEMEVPPDAVLRTKVKQAGVNETVEVAIRSFLRRLFWTLEALSRYDLHAPGA